MSEISGDLLDLASRFDDFLQSEGLYSECTAISQSEALRDRVSKVE
ncbi:MAG: hypothetical protein QNJ55_05965 [Xenococcus sp. MO_188.B8]|nr:hypothetical protein [Xenococcus sp. MO_188.B8]